MKRILITSFIMLILSHYYNSIFAQKNEDKKKEKKMVIKIDKEVDGKVTKIDTTIVLKEGDDPAKILEKYGVNEKKEGKHTKTYKVDVDMSDSDNVKHKQNYVYVNVDDNDDTIHVKKHRNKVVVISPDEFDMPPFHLSDDDDVMMFKHLDGNEVYHIKELKSDSDIFEKQIIIAGDDDMRHKKVFKFQGDDNSGDVFMFRNFDGPPMEHRMMMHDMDDSDSTIITVRKYKDGKVSDETHRILKPRKEKKIMIKVLDVEKEDIAKLKLKDNYKKLDVKDFNIMMKDEKLTINFELAEKSNTNVKITDNTGKQIFNEDLKQFSGKYSKDIEAVKGESYIQINQGNKYFIKKLQLDF